mmetsp:Transcript_2014/g.6011  ORF Transcript_2014/g.6011 Transcript_2014/m.6011 type:complete len:227 (+) Transcript_2014:203-883(+)
MELYDTTMRIERTKSRFTSTSRQPPCPSVTLATTSQSPPSEDCTSTRYTGAYRGSWKWYLTRVTLHTSRRFTCKTCWSAAPKKLDHNEPKLPSMAFDAGKWASCAPAEAETKVRRSSVPGRIATIRCFVDSPRDVVATPTSSPMFHPIDAGSCFKKSSVEPATAVRLSNVHVRALGSPTILMVLLSPDKNRSPKIGWRCTACFLTWMVAVTPGLKPMGSRVEPTKN